MDAPVHRAELVHALAVYFRRNPHACDAPAGIVRWWLPPDLCATEAELGSLLDWLVSRGIVECLPIPGAAGVYRRRTRDASSDSALDELIRASEGLH